jgi:hypothetical protein
MPGAPYHPYPTFGEQAFGELPFGGTYWVSQRHRGPLTAVLDSAGATSATVQPASTAVVLAGNGVTHSEEVGSSLIFT